MEQITVLNVDDSEVSRYYRATVMRQAGFRVVEATTGAEAIERFRTEDPAVVLLDVHLPDIDGFEVCRRMKEIRRLVTPVVIHITSSYQEISHRVHGLESGADGYLNEPVEPELLLATVRSLLRLRSAEAKVIESQARLEIVIDAAGLGLWEADIHSGRVKMSQRAREILGCTNLSEEVSDEEARRRIHPADIGRATRLYERAIAGQADFECEFRVTGAGGHRWVFSRGRLIDPAAGGPRRIAGVVQDVTRRKLIEEAFARSNRELSQFAFAAAHDLQEPLRTVSSFTQMLARDHFDRFDEKGRQSMDFILEAVNHMQQLIQGVLQFSQVGGGESPPSQVVDTQAAAASVLTDLQRAINEHHAAVTVGALPEVRGDPAQIRQIFQNLIGNSIKYRSQVPPRIDISAESSGDMALFRIADNGQGFDPQQADVIFGMFKRLHGRSTPGAGIGLAITRKIVERHGGRIWAESTPGKGSVFFFTLPAARGRETAAPG